MATWDDVARVCLALPGTTEAVSVSGRRRWLDETLLRELAAEAWAARAPARLVAENPLPPA
jgi:hypothetical protein